MILLKLHFFLNSSAFAHAHRKSAHHLDETDLIFIKILQPFWYSSSQNPITNHSPQPPSLEDNKKPPRKVASEWKLNR
jgi:hypothetical protein